ncbi:MAG: hypothetical protein Q8M16_23330 [Pirellulaceae bacterium]|nr:hypothetical protein [Pirellulaceae bacterium]
MLVIGKALGSKKKLFDEFSVPLPPRGDDDDGGGGDFTLRDLIERVVRHEVRAFRKRQTDRQFVRALTATQIETAAEKGKVEMGGSEVGLQHVDEEDAVHAAWTAFDDGLYLVVVDEVQCHNLDQTLFLADDSQITFVRLTMLTGA